MSYLKCFGLSLFIISSCLGGENNDKSIIKPFDKRNIAAVNFWVNGKMVKSGNKKFTPSYNGSPAVLFFKNSPKDREGLGIMLKEFSTIGFSNIVFQFKASRGAYVVASIRWDGKKVMRRFCNYKPGTGKWEKIVVPVKGSKARFVISVSERKDYIKEPGEPDEIRELQLKPLTLKREDPGKLSQRLYKIDLPVVIPKPKSSQCLNKKIILSQNGNVEFGICTGNNGKSLKNIIIGELIEYCGLKKNNVIVKANIKDLSASRIIIKLNLKENIDTIPVPDKKEAYAIKCNIKDGKNIITLAANDKAGLYWAWVTLRQLIVRDKKNVNLILRDIVDWPDFQIRDMYAYTLSQAFKVLSMKCSPQYPWWRAKGVIWNMENTPKGQSFIKHNIQFTDLCVARGLNSTMGFCPHFEKDSVTVSNDNQIERLFQIYDKTLSRGNRRVCVNIDDGGRRKKSFTEADKKAYNNDKLLSHAWYAKKMSDRIWKSYPDAEILVITSKYEYPTGIEGYYNKIGVSKDLAIIWTGEQCVTFDYPKSVIERYKRGIEGRRFMIHDNTPGQVHGMRRGLTICEKYGEGYKNLYCDECIGIEGGGPGNQISLIMCLSIAEYAWNASKYNAEESRQRAIAKIAGNSKAVKPILMFSQEYLKIAYKYPVDKLLNKPEKYNPETGMERPALSNLLNKRELTRYQIRLQEYNKLQKRIAFLKQTLNEIEENSKNHDLNAIFRLYYDNLVTIINYLYKNSKELVTVTPHGKFYFDINDIPGGCRYQKRDNGKVSTALYGIQTSNNALTVVFNVNELPSQIVRLVLEGQDCDKNIATMKLSVNGHKIYQGNTPFVQNGWKKQAFSIPAEYFKIGRNKIEVSNITESSDYIDHWVMISEIALEY